MRRRGITIIVALLTALPLGAQKKSELKAIWLEAESHYLYGEFELANPLYLILNNLFPGNANIKYKIGNCYLNIFDEKQKSITFLEEAVKNASYDSKSNLLKETRAPLDAYFSLGNSYRIANKLDSALMTYQMFRNLLSGTGEMANQDFIDQQIQACNIAIEKMKSPILVNIDPLKEYINQGSVNEMPAVSFDEQVMAYTERRGLENAVFITRKEGDSWGTPVDITAEAEMGTDCYSTSLNSDGTELYLFKNDNYDGNIYVTTFVDGRWSPIKKLNKNINTKFYESHASISPDGNRLYFTSNREESLGELDIWVSEKDAWGEWGVPANLGNTVNTPFNEETPAITKDGKTLIFSSEGHGSMGGYDIFITSLGTGGWGKPENIGYPLSTTDDDLGFHPVDNGAYGFYSVLTGYKKKEIALVTFDTPLPALVADTTAAKDTIKLNFDLNTLPYITITDSSSLIRDLIMRDVLDTDEADANVLYFTVQVMALYNPVDPAFFEHATIRVFYNSFDRFFRYTTGQFATKEEAYAEKERLLRIGYPTDIFVKKVYRE
ncbi:MAG: hypothetical protein E4G92_01780 [Bacteroidia bacterium]|nr:MAG: hypothetical protein E4G92_01780 [Bacteroidia bacterium]